MKRASLAGLLVLAAAGAALAADAEAVEDNRAADPRDIIIDVGLGAQLQPIFPSAKQYEVSPMPLFDLQALRIPFTNKVVGGGRNTFSLFPSIAVVGERDDADAAYLAGIPDVDTAVELGVGAAIQNRFVRAFAAVRYGVTGHNGIVGEGGVDLRTAFLSDTLTISAGPRVSVASEEYMDTYFSVGPGAVVLPAYNANAGFRDVGLAMKATYALTDSVRIVGKARYTHFVGEAGDSPIVDAGNKDEFRIGIGLTYRLGLDLY